MLDHQAVDALRLAALRWGERITVAPCPATAVPMAVVPPMPSLDVTVAGIANDARHGMEAGNSREAVIDPIIALVSALVIDPVIGLVIVSMIEPVIDLENASVIARKSGSAIAPVPSTEIRTPPVRTFKTTAQGLDVFAIATTATAIAVAPGMNGANRPSAPDPGTTRAVLSARRQHRRLPRPHPQRTI